MIIMEPLVVWQEALISSWAEVWGAFLSVLPTILGAILVFSIGLIISYWVKRLVKEFTKIIKLDKLTESAGIESYLKKAEIKYSLSDLVATLMEWLVIFIFFLAVVDILGLSSVSEVLVSVLSYIPNIIAAVLIFAAGYIIGGVVDGLVRGALASVDHGVAKPLGKTARWVVILIAFFAAIDQLKVAQGLVSIFFQGLTYTIVLVVGLSVGLGGKDLVSRILNDWYEKIRK